MIGWKTMPNGLFSRNCSKLRLLIRSLSNPRAVRHRNIRSSSFPIRFLVQLIFPILVLWPIPSMLGRIAKHGKQPIMPCIVMLLTISSRGHIQPMILSKSIQPLHLLKFLFWRRFRKPISSNSRVSNRISISITIRLPCRAYNSWKRPTSFARTV